MSPLQMGPKQGLLGITVPKLCGLLESQVGSHFFIRFLRRKLNTYLWGQANDRERKKRQEFVGLYSFICYCCFVLLLVDPMVLHAPGKSFTVDLSRMHVFYYKMAEAV